MKRSSPAARPFVAGSVFLCSVLSCASAGAAAGPGDPDAVLPGLQVTATRQAEPADDALPSVTLISAEDIRRSAAQDLPELLRLQPGVDIVRSGGPGGQTSVFLRGAKSNHVLVLVDGVRAASANTGAFAWEQL
ncbi:MAG: TonB-dependent receptor plug domain-containing protein, partial [Xanthomonadales bacterium]|nr:TonB-dependent receptor plug domain-containing protein [Xanthomonadales bacterium]